MNSSIKVTSSTLVPEVLAGMVTVLMFLISVTEMFGVGSPLTTV